MKDCMLIEGMFIYLFTYFTLWVSDIGVNKIREQLLTSILRIQSSVTS
jgi:hypothetical protein